MTVTVYLVGAKELLPYCYDDLFFTIDRVVDLGILLGIPDNTILMIGYLFCHLRLRGTQLENKYVLGSYRSGKNYANHALTILSVK